MSHKAKANAASDFTQNTDFSEPAGPSGPVARHTEDGAIETVRGSDLQADIETIRARRAKDRAKRGLAGKPRRINNYLDAERLRNLHTAGHTHLISHEEIVDCEESGFYDKPGQESMVPGGTPNGSIAPPADPEVE